MPLIPGPVGTAYVPDLEVPNVVGQVNTMRELAQRDRQLGMQQQQIDQQGQAQQSLRTHQQQQAVASRLNSLVQVMQTQPEAAEKLINADPELLSALKLPGGVKFMEKVGDYQLFRNNDTGDINAVDPRHPSLGMKYVGNVGPGKESYDDVRKRAFEKLSPDEQAAAVKGAGGRDTVGSQKSEILLKYRKGGRAALSDEDYNVIASEVSDPLYKQATSMVTKDYNLSRLSPDKQVKKIGEVFEKLKAQSGAAVPAGATAPGQGGGTGAGAGAATGAGTFPVVQPLGTALPQAAGPAVTMGGPAATAQPGFKAGTNVINRKTKEVGTVHADGTVLPADWVEDTSP